MTDLLVACSPGGHWAEARRLISLLNDVSILYVVHDLSALPVESAERVIAAPSAKRDLTFVSQLLFACRVVKRERPKVVLSTGANIGVAFGIAAKLFAIPVVFVETITRVSNPSLSGRLMYYIADRYYVQSAKLARKLPRAIFKGGLD